MRVVLDMRSGPMAGKRKEAEVGPGPQERLVLGREPGPEGFLLDGDVTVSRKHGALQQEGPWLIYENLSSNGTVLGRKVLMGRERLKPGAVLRIGRHEIEVRYDLPADSTVAVEPDRGLFQRGPLARPAVRVVLAAYLLGLAALAVLLAGSGAEGSSFPTARRLYETRYLADHPGLDTADRRERLAVVDRLADELEAQVHSEQWLSARDTCRRLMAVDADPHSPIYRFAAHRLADLADRS